MTTSSLPKPCLLVACVLLSACAWTSGDLYIREPITETSRLKNDAHNNQQQDIGARRRDEEDDLQKQKELAYSRQQKDDKNDFSHRQPEQRNPVEPQEFFLTHTDKPQLPFDVESEFVLPDDKNWGKLEPVWKCEDKKRPTKLVLVNIATQEEEDGGIQGLLSSYASSCRAGYLSVDSCKDLSWESMNSRPGGMWASAAGSNCLVRSVGDRNGKRAYMKNASPKLQNSKKAGISSPVLQNSVDMLAGDVPLGCADKWLAKEQVMVDDIAVEQFVDVQYIVALASPEAWLIQTALSSSSSVTTEKIIKAIRRKVDNSNGKQQQYQELYASYLITPNQHAWIQQERAELTIQQRANLALANLRDMNALVMIADKQHMEESALMIQHFIAQDNLAVVEGLAEQDSAVDVQNVLAELTKDTVLAKQVEEYLKFDRGIYNQAILLHKKQLKWIRRDQGGDEDANVRHRN